MLLITVTSLPHHCHCQYYQRHHCQSSPSKKVPRYRIADGAIKVHRTSVWPDDRLSCSVVNAMGDYLPTELPATALWERSAEVLDNPTGMEHRENKLHQPPHWQLVYCIYLQDNDKSEIAKYGNEKVLTDILIQQYINSWMKITALDFSHLNLREQCQCCRYPSGEWLFKFTCVFF